MKSYRIDLPDDLDDFLEWWSEMQGMTKSEIIREAINAFPYMRIGEPKEIIDVTEINNDEDRSRSDG
jgi:hypothetical protein